nr:hypothetical protein JVH1_8366 [Rhodococcus sp. JVH1]
MTILVTDRHATRAYSHTDVAGLCAANHATLSSNALVMFAAGRAHGTISVTTPWSGHRILDTEARTKHRMPPISR